jgi:Fe-S-cluster containining protein
MSCRQCGRCCTPMIRIDTKKLNIYIGEMYKHGYTEEDVFNDDFLFIYEHLLDNEISKKEAIKRNPLLKSWMSKDSHIFVCPFLGSDNKCKVHNKLRKDGMCDNFPYYKGKLETKILYNKECGYLTDEGR